MFAAVKDLDLVERYARQGDPEVFAEIVQRHTAMVYYTCLRVLRDKALAEDASQDTFLRLMRAPDKVTRSLGAWLHQTATRRSLDMLRSDSARKRREHEHGLEYLANDDHQYGEPPAWRVLSPQIDTVLEKLDDQTRILLVEHFLAGKPQRQIAKEQRLSTATVCRKIRAGLVRLRKELGGVGLIATIGTITALMASQQAEAAPATLTTEMGKLSMVSGNPWAFGTSFRFITPVKAATAVAASMALVLCGMVVYLMLQIGNGQPTVTPTISETQTPTVGTIHGLPRP